MMCKEYPAKDFAQMYKRAKDAIDGAELKYGKSLDSFLNIFAPVPPPKQNSKWLDFFLDIATAGAMSGLGKVFSLGKML